MTIGESWSLMAVMIGRRFKDRGWWTASTTLAMATLFVAGCATEKFTVDTARMAASRGDARAEYFLGKAYANGRGVAQDNVKAVEYLRQAASQGEAEAQNDLGAFYAQGLGVPQNDTEAVKWFRLAAEQGDPLAEYSLGSSFFWGHGVAKDLNEAVKWYRRAATQGQLDAELELGDIYLGGRGLATDYRSSAKWYRKAAAQHSAIAINALGYIHEQGGFGVARDTRAAVKRYRQAAAMGDAKGQMNLGRMYMNGMGIPKDLIEAYKWIYLATKTGDGMGRHYLSALDGTHNYGDFTDTPLTAEQIKEAMRRVEEFRKARAKGD